MGGVDRMHKNIAMYRIKIRNKKWYRDLLSWLIDVSIHSAWQLKRGGGTKITQLDFRREIVQVYLIKYKNPIKAQEDHLPVNYVHTNDEYTVMYDMMVSSITFRKLRKRDDLQESTPKKKLRLFAQSVQNVM